jgi:hypothetical protein
MSTTKKAAVVGLAALTFAGGAVAAGKHAHRGVLLKTAATYLGLNKDALRSDLRAGQTLSQIATAHGKSVAGLEAALVGAVKTKLDARVAAGKLTAAREQTVLARVQGLVDRLVNTQLKAGRHGGRARLAKIAASYIGVTPKQLAAEVKGSSLAAVATAHGKTAQGLESALLAPLKQRLDKAVAAKRITSAQASARLAKATARIAAFVTKTR